MKEARRLLGWSSADLAQAAGVGVATIWRAEARREKDVSMIPATAAAVEQAFRKAGIELLKDGSTRKRRRR
jgi:transcriptional regulator with XRE-family HTH domain